MNIKKWKNISIIFSLILGIVLHFAYDLSGKNVIIGLFSAINESIWEHLKLTFFPMLIISIIGYVIWGKECNCYIKSNAIGIIFSIILTTILFYTYSGILGENYAIIDISIFFISVILSEYVIYDVLIKNSNCNNEKIYIIYIVAILICFVYFTFLPPKIAYFKDPINNTYGIEK